jgi:hypothetical protein
MLKGSELVHHSYLCSLVHRLIDIGEDKFDIESIIQEPVWTPRGGVYHTLCDLILLYHDNSASAVELKGNRHKRHKAVEQLNAGREYISSVLRRDYRYGIFVVYDPGRYIFERIL